MKRCPSCCSSPVSHTGLRPTFHNRSLTRWSHTGLTLVSYRSHTGHTLVSRWSHIGLTPVSDQSFTNDLSHTGLTHTGARREGCPSCCPASRRTVSPIFGTCRQEAPPPGVAVRASRVGVCFRGCVGGYVRTCVHVCACVRVPVRASVCVCVCACVRACVRVCVPLG